MQTPYFIFEIEQNTYGVSAEHISEVLALPEIILLPNVPLGIVGVIDIRGEILPVLDLRLQVDDQPLPYDLTDSLVVLEQKHVRIGMIVNSIDDLQTIAAEDITVEIEETQNVINPQLERLFAGSATQADRHIWLLGDPAAWFEPSEVQQVVAVTRFLVNEINSQTSDALVNSSQGKGHEAEPSLAIAKIDFCPTATPEERQIFYRRAEALRQSADRNQQIEDTKTLVVIVLNDHYFGIEAELVKEFMTIQQATPVPCCPNHILGNMNLRGEVVAIVDIAQSLGLVLHNLAYKPKAVVVEFANTFVTIVVEAIREATFSIRPSELNDVVELGLPIRSRYVQGAVPYGDQSLYVLDLPSLLRSNVLAVNEVL